MLFSEKTQSSMQQEDKLKCIRYATNIPREAWIYLAYRFLSQHVWVSCQVLFSLDEAKNRCSYKITMLQNP
jgi:hypothetical protein